ncbi:hypothetical protein ACFL1B_04170 [Nanoarchaeota archaeon]
MKKDMVWVPGSIAARPSEDIYGKVFPFNFHPFFHFTLAALNLSTLKHFVYHFSSVEDYLENQDQLTPGDAVVSFRELKVAGKEISDYTRDFSRSGNLYTERELILSLTSGGENLDFSYRNRMIEEGESQFAGFVGDPIIGSDIGDKVRVYRADYAEDGNLSIPINWFFRNDAHYAQMRRDIGAPKKRLEKRLEGAN